MGDKNWQGGIDLNQDGVIRPEEQVQNYNQNGLVGDPGDWEQFAVSNADALQRQVAFFGWALSPTVPLKTDNPIHELLAIESELAGPKEIQNAYTFVAEVIKRVRQKLSDGRERTNREKVQLVYRVMEELGVRFIDQEDSLFATNVKKGVLDCDTSSFVALAVAHEMGWPLALVLAPRHAFVRWEGEGERFNVDMGVIYSDSFYVNWLKISPESIEGGVYLASRSRRQVLAHFFANRGVAKANLGRYAKAIQDFTEVIRLDPNDAQAYNNRGVAKGGLGRRAEAIEDYTTAIHLNPNDVTAYNNRGATKEKLGRYAEAVEDYKTALRLDPNNAKAKNNLAELQKFLEERD